MKLLEDVSTPAVAIADDITLDLNGKTWTVAAGTNEISGDVYVVDNSTAGGGSVVGPFAVSGGLAVGDADGHAATVTGDIVATGPDAVVVVANGSTVDGDLVADSGATAMVMGSVSGDVTATGASEPVAGGDPVPSSVTVVSGTVGGDVVAEDGATAYVGGNGASVAGSVCGSGEGTTVQVAGGTVAGPVTATEGAEASVTGGTLQDGIAVDADSSVKVSGADTVVNDGIFGNGKIEVAGGTVNGGIDGDGEIKVSGGAVNGGIDTDGKLTITGGTITAAVGADEPAISAGGATEISGGTVNGDVEAVTGADVKISGTAAIEGNIESNGDGTKIGISGGTVDGTLSESNDGDLSVTGGHFSEDPSDYVAEGYYADGDDTNGYDVKERKSLEGAVITVADATYDGAVQTPVPTVTVDGEALVLDVDFVAVYATNDLVNADTYDVTIVAIGAWIGSADTTFMIGKKQVIVKAKDMAVAFRTPVADVEAAYEFEYDGIVDGEDPADVVATAPTASSDYAADSPAGSTFDIAVDVTGAAADNYTFVASETKGVLTVGAAEAPTMLETTAITVADTTVTLRHRLLEGAKYYTYFTATSLTNEWKAAADSRTLDQLTTVVVQPEEGESYSAGEWTFTGVDDPVRFYQIGYSSVPYAEGDAMGLKPAEGGDEP